MIKQNLHTHSLYCDGKNTLEELTEAAIERGFSSIGFSGHCYTPFDSSYCMSIENTKKYCFEIDCLKEKYGDRIKIYKGIEYDLYSELDTSEFEYIIGSVHYVYKNGCYLPVDLSADEVTNVVNEHFNGNAMDYVKAYYEELIKVPDATKCDILGHFDLVTKFCESASLFSPESDEYLTYAFDAVHTISRKLKVFEVNTGAMSRGYRSLPYPSIDILKEMKNCAMLPVISSDCHNAEHLDYAYDVAYDLIKKAGFSSALAFDEGKFVEYPV